MQNTTTTTTNTGSSNTTTNNSSQANQQQQQQLVRSVIGTVPLIQAQHFRGPNGLVLLPPQYTGPQRSLPNTAANNQATAAAAAVMNSQSEQTLRACLEKFKRVLPEEKYTRLEILVKQLQMREITRDEFDKKYFEIMLPYVTPPSLPQRYLTAQTLYIPPYRLSQDAKKQFLTYFQVSRDQKYDMLKANPELVQILRQFVILQRQQQIPITEAEAVSVVHIDGEQPIAPAAEPSSSTVAAIGPMQPLSINDEVAGPSGSFISNKRVKREQHEVQQDQQQQQQAKEGSESEEEELVKLREVLQLLQEQHAVLSAEHEKLKSEINNMRHELQLYKYANVDEMDKIKYDELCTISEVLCNNLSTVNKVLKRKHDEEQNDKHAMNCIICYENRKNVIFRPCSHVVQCDCCPVPKECPVCKKKIEMACKIFI